MLNSIADIITHLMTVPKEKLQCCGILQMNVLNLAKKMRKTSRFFIRNWQKNRIWSIIT
jgi:ribosomal protein L28